MRRVLVTGGGTGIGRAIAHAFAEEGDNVTICGRRISPLEDSARGREIEIRQADVTREADVASLFDSPYQVVVANAGFGHASKLAETSLADWSATVETSLTGTFLTFREALRGMGPGGRLIAIASTAALQGGANIAAYAAAKHGVLGLVRSLAHEVAKRDITCNAVCPGFVDTPMAEAAVESLMARFDIDRGDAVAKIVAGNPVGRMITPREVAKAVHYLAGSEAAMVNGHALSLSGGEI